MPVEKFVVVLLTCCDHRCVCYYDRPNSLSKWLSSLWNSCHHNKLSIFFYLVIFYMLVYILQLCPLVLQEVNSELLR